MRPLLFVNWRRLNTRFTVLMWIVAAALALVVLIHAAGAGPDPASARTSPHVLSAHGSPPAARLRP